MGPTQLGALALSSTCCSSQPPRSLLLGVRPLRRSRQEFALKRAVGRGGSGGGGDSPSAPAAGAAETSVRAVLEELKGPQGVGLVALCLLWEGGKVASKVG